MKNRAASNLQSRSDMCPVCKGMGAYIPDFPYGHADYGKAVRCLNCADLFKTSQLPKASYGLTIDSLTSRIDDPTNQVQAMRFLAKQLLKRRAGFLSLVGLCGNGKTHLSQSIVAEFCRLKIAAEYYTVPNLAIKLTTFNGDGEQVRPEILIQRLKRVTVLILDEADKITWTAWKMQLLGEVIDYRSQHSDSLVTVIVANTEPMTWQAKEDVNLEPINSRMKDRLHNRIWPSEYLDRLPDCLRGYVLDGLHYAPGYFQVTLPDARQESIG